MRAFTTYCLIIFASLFAVIGPPESKAQKPKAASLNYLWFEGEDAESHNFKNQGWFAASNYRDTKHKLSGENWLVSAGNRQGAALKASWKLTIPQKGSYQFKTRKFWLHGPFKWRFGKTKWRECGRNVGLLDSATLAKHVNANWVSLGEVYLKKGKVNFEIELLAKDGESATACFDCFILHQGPFVPRGKLKPGEKSGAADAGMFAFEPDLEGSKEGAFDLRRLNEKEAGESGFVTHKNGRFYLGSGEAVRFWGVNVGGGILKLDNASIDHLALMLARRGVNGVRVHTPFFDKSAKNPEKIDQHLLSRLHYAIAAFKAQGIYTNLSFYFPLWFDIQKSYGIDGYDKIENKRPYAAIFFNPRLQEIHRAWAKALLSSRNPHTKTKLSDEPAISHIELVNEDSLFFWTFAAKNIPPKQMAILEKRYGTWLKKKYGKLQGLWNGAATQSRDKPASGTMHLFDAWDMTSHAMDQASAAKKARVQDQVAFLASVQRGYYEGEIEHYRKKLGVKSLMSCSNWHTADPALLAPVEHYSYHAGDIIDRHAYFGGPHQGEASSYAVREGQSFDSRSALRVPHETPFANARYESLPEIYSEFGWPNPNRFRAEWTFLSAAYGSLQGIDGFMHFAINSAAWTHSIQKFHLSDVAALASFPAMALAYRRGDIEEGKSIVTETLEAEKILALSGTQIPHVTNLDALRQVDGNPKRLPLSALKVAPLVGKATFAFGKKASFKDEKKKLAAGIDGKGRRIQSASKELLWDYGKGVATISAPRVQGACGFLGAAGEIKTKSCVFTSKNEYLSLSAISLDDKPLTSTKRMLVQAIPENRPHGWKVDGRRIASLGGYPMNVQEVDATITLARSKKPKRVSALDANGHTLKQKVEWKHKGGKLVLTLPRNALYTLVEW